MFGLYKFYESFREDLKEWWRLFQNLPPKDVRDILVVRFSAMGDIILTTPIVRALKTRYPDARITFLTKNAYADLLTSNPYIDRVIGLGDDFGLMIAELRSRDYDLLVDLHKNIRSKRVKSKLGNTQYYTFNKMNIQKWLLVNFRLNVLPDKSIVDRYFDGLKKLSLQNDQKGLDYFIPENMGIKAAQDLPMSHQTGFVACVVGGTYNTKKMPADQWLELCKKIELPMIIVGGDEDREIGTYLERNTPHRKVYNACGKFSVHESADLIRRSMSVISHDTGMMHIAAAYQKPIITLWGNTVERFGMFPYMPSVQHKYFSSEVKMACRPCSKLGYDACPKKHFKCMKNQNHSDILKDLKKSLTLAN